MLNMVAPLVRAKLVSLSRLSPDFVNSPGLESGRRAIWIYYLLQMAPLVGLFQFGERAYMV